MKRTTINVFTILAVLAIITLAGCLKNSDTPPEPQPAITGDFEGPFIVVKKNANGYDTLVNDTLHLRLNADSGFTVTGDTITHAASHGTFTNKNFILFNDERYSLNTEKYYLAGLYNYYYDGQKLQITRNYIDNIGLIYDLHKQ